MRRAILAVTLLGLLATGRPTFAGYIGFEATTASSATVAADGSLTFSLGMLSYHGVTEYQFNDSDHYPPSGLLAITIYGVTGSASSGFSYTGTSTTVTGSLTVGGAIVTLVSGTTGGGTMTPGQGIYGITYGLYPTLDENYTLNPTLAAYYSVGPTGLGTTQGAITYDNGTFTAQIMIASLTVPDVVPEPSSLMLCGIFGAAGMTVAGIRRGRGGR